MKKSILLFASILCLSASNRLSAQDTKQFSFGFKVSPNFSWVKVVDGPMENNGLGLGFSYGLTADYNLLNSPNYWINAELMVTSLPSSTVYTSQLKGINYDNVGSNDKVKFDYKNQYLQIPISFKFKTDQIEKLKYYFQLGLGMSFGLSHRLTTTSNPSIYGNSGLTNHDPNDTRYSEYDFDGGTDKATYLAFKDDINGFRSSLIVGAGVEYNLSSNMNLVAGLKFDNGFSDVFADDRVNARNNFLSLQVGITF
jgi:opacity protein-like surface antigen